MIFPVRGFDNYASDEQKEIADFGRKLCDGKGYVKTNLYSFYRSYKSVYKLTWIHYRILLQVHDETACKWYEKEAYEQTWSVCTLQRNIDTQYYYRMLQSQDKKAIEAEMKEKTSSYQNSEMNYYLRNVNNILYRGSGCSI